MLSIYLGAILDYLFGELSFFTHPVVHIGRLIKWLEERLYHTKNRKLSGCIVVGIVSVVCYMIPYLILKGMLIVYPQMAFLASAFFIYQILAIHSLKKETLKVYAALKNNNLEKARRELSYLVTRETSEMTKSQIIMSTIETVAENIVDGITSPLFYIAIGGAPLGFLYKGVSTLDSMVGYKNERYHDFGWASARMDDILNFIPARVTSMIILAAVFLLGYNYEEAKNVLIKDRHKSSSPNSGWSEAPIAGALEIYFGGPLKYFNKIVEKPVIGIKDEFSIKKIIYSHRILDLTSGLSLIIFTFGVWIWRSI